MKKWTAGGMTTLIGSMPHKDREKAIDLILKDSREIPVWPQLSSYPAEQMMAQYLEGFPGITTKAGGHHLSKDTPQFNDDLMLFYEDYLEVDAGNQERLDSRFRFGPETGATFYPFLEALHRNSAAGAQAVKGQVVGPFTLLTGLKDQQDRLSLYDEQFQDALPKHLAMKAKWQIERLRVFDLPVILFIDEPALAGYGSSAFISVSRELVLQLLQEVVNTIHDAGALAGVHVCANTDWTLAFDSGVDIVNFDAYGFFDRFALYRDAFSRFMIEGRTVAWGMVPTSDPDLIRRETAQSLADRWLKDIEDLTSSDLSLRRILAQSLFTPSCGCGSLPEEAAQKVLQLNRELGEIIRRQL